MPRLLRSEPATDDEAWALELLRGWDGDLSADSVAAAVYDAWIAAIGTGLFAEREDTADRYLAWRESFVCAALPRILDDGLPSWAPMHDVDELLRTSLAAAVSWLEDHLGSDRAGWRWGAMHRVRFAHVLARMPGLEEVFLAGDHELGGDEQTVLQAGFDGRDGFEAIVIPSYRVVVDLADVDAARAVLPTGQSGHPTSPHWNDQGRLWIAGELREAPVSRAAVEATSDRVLLLSPG